MRQLSQAALTASFGITILARSFHPSLLTGADSVKSKRTEVALCIGLLLYLWLSPDARGGQWQTTVVDQSLNDAWPQVSEGRVAWTGGYGNDSEIFVYENGVTKQLTNDHLRDSLIGIAGNHVAWSEYVPSQNGPDTVNLILDGKTVGARSPV